MPVSEEFREFILERLETVGRVTARKMFGALGIYSEGTFFAIVSGNTLYFKVDENSRPDYEAAGMRPFRPFGEESYAMSYYEVPADVLEDNDLLRKWMAEACRAAEQSIDTRSRKKYIADE
jgi:DNA transformation protein